MHAFSKVDLTTTVGTLIICDILHTSTNCTKLECYELMNQFVNFSLHDRTALTSVTTYGMVRSNINSI